MPKTIKLKTKHHASSNPPSPLKPKTEQAVYKDTVISILLARLDHNKAFDWFELSRKLRNDWADVDGKDGSKGKSQKGKGKNKEDGEGMSGSEFREIYQDIILPALKKGEIPWDRERSVSTVNSTPPPRTPSSSGVEGTISSKENVKTRDLQPKGIKARGKAKGKADELEDEDSMSEYGSEEEEDDIEEE